MSSSSEENNKTTTSGKQRAAIIGAVLLSVLLFAGIILAVATMMKNPGQTETIRDIVIIFMAMESLVIGLTLIVLIVQLARLTALLENEIRPILNSTTETVQTLRGTTAFLSSKLVKPVIKVNSTIAAIRQVLDLVGIGRSNSTE